MLSTLFLLTFGGKLRYVIYHACSSFLQISWQSIALLTGLTVLSVADLFGRKAERMKQSTLDGVWGREGGKGKRRRKRREERIMNIFKKERNAISMSTDVLAQ